jgi:hypothetical protein
VAYVVSPFGHFRGGDGHRLRSQGPLMDSVPDATQAEHTQVQDDLSAVYRPGHMSNRKGWVRWQG